MRGTVDPGFGTEFGPQCPGGGREDHTVSLLRSASECHSSAQVCLRKWTHTPSSSIYQDCQLGGQEVLDGWHALCNSRVI